MLSGHRVAALTVNPDILVDQFLAARDIGRLAATDRAAHNCCIEWLRSIRRENLALASFRLQSLLERIRRGDGGR